MRRYGYRPRPVTSAKRRGLRFLKRHRKLLLLIGGIAAAAIVLLAVFVFPNLGKAPGAQTPAATEEGYTTQEEYQQAIQNNEIDAETIAGLSGTDEALFEDTQTDASLRIGVTVLNNTPEIEAMLLGMEKRVIADAQQQGVDVSEYFYLYDAANNQNQQIQDVLTMVNNGVKVIIVAGTDAYNFIKIADIAQSNKIPLVAYNAAAERGYTVNVRQSQDGAQQFAQFLKDAGQSSTMLVGKVSEAQQTAIEAILPLDAVYPDYNEAVEAIGTSVTDGTPKQSAIVMDANANDTLQAWVQRGALPQAYAGYATVAYVKTWYQLLNGGIEIQTDTQPGATPEPSASPKPDVSPDPAGSAAPANRVQATPQQFQAMGLTTVANSGEIVYEIVVNLAQGKTLKEQGSVYELPGAEIITNENIAQFYEQVKDQQSGFVTSQADASQVAGLFEQE